MRGRAQRPSPSLSPSVGRGHSPSRKEKGRIYSARSNRIFLMRPVDTSSADDAPGAVAHEMGELGHL